MTLQSGCCWRDRDFVNSTTLHTGIWSALIDVQLAESIHSSINNSEQTSPLSLGNGMPLPMISQLSSIAVNINGVLNAQTVLIEQASSIAMQQAVTLQQLRIEQMQSNSDLTLHADFVTDQFTSFASTELLAQNYNVRFLANSQFNQQVDFLFDGQLQLGNDAADSHQFAQGFSHNTGSSMLAGQIIANADVQFNQQSIQLIADTHFTGQQNNNLSFKDIIIADQPAFALHIEQVNQLSVVGPLINQGDLILDTQLVMQDATMVQSLAGQVQLAAINNYPVFTVQAQQGITLAGFAHTNASGVQLTLNNQQQAIQINADIIADTITINNQHGAVMLAQAVKLHSRNDPLQITAADIQIAGSIYAPSVQFNASQGYALLLQSDQLYSGENVFDLSWQELNQIQVNNDGVIDLTLAADQLVYLAGGLPMASEAQEVEKYNLSVITHNDSGQVFIGTSPVTLEPALYTTSDGGTGSFSGLFNQQIADENGLNPSVGRLHVNNLTVESGDIYVFGKITTEQVLTLDSNYNMVLSKTPFLNSTINEFDAV